MYVGMYVFMLSRASQFASIFMTILRDWDLSESLLYWRYYVSARKKIGGKLFKAFHVTSMSSVSMQSLSRFCVTQ
jgi:hypothetical protein